MSPANKHFNATHKGQHGSVSSYIIGFLLSLIFTAIPYYLVVHKLINGKQLLGIILGIAVVQMLIQIFFFLHLGRGPKPLYNVVFFVSTVGLILVVVLGSIFIMDNLHYNMSTGDTVLKLAQNESIAQVSGKLTGACPDVKENHKVTITGGMVSPTHTDAHMCDTLTFIHKDAGEIEIAFGPHPQHLVYGGETEVLLRKNYPKTITLNQLGAHLFHDHLNPNINGSFTIAP